MTLPLLPRIPSRLHPAWLVLAIPPALWMAARGVGLDPGTEAGSRPAALALWIACGLGLLLWLERPGRGATSARLAKEVRPLLPGMLVGLVPAGLMPLAAGWFPEPVIVITAATGGLLMAGSALGSEFDHGTLPGLLAEPGGRFRILGMKLAVLAVALGFGGVALDLAWLDEWGPGLDGGERRALAWMIVTLVATTPGYTLLARSGLAGMAFTVAAPLVLALAGMTACLAAFRLQHPGAEIPDPLPGFDAALHFGRPAYLLCGAALTVAGFLRAGGQTGRAASESGCLHPMARPVDVLLRRILPSGPVAALVRKELQVHVVPWLVAAIQLGLWGLWMGLRQFGPDGGMRELAESTAGPLMIAGVLGAIAIAATGAAAVAEERQLGTLAWQLTVPVPVRRQWAVKCGVTAAVAATAGVALPLGLLALDLGPDGLREAVGRDPVPAFQLSVCGLVAMLLWSFGLHASSLCRRSMDALGVAVAMAFVLGLLAMSTGALMVELLDSQVGRLASDPARHHPPPAWVRSVWVMAMLPWVGGSLLATAQILLAGGNARLDPVPARAWVGQGILLAGVTVAGVLLSVGLAFALMVLVKGAGPSPAGP